jgi:hypothetical protein
VENGTILTVCILSIGQSSSFMRVWPIEYKLTVRR